MASHRSVILYSLAGAIATAACSGAASQDVLDGTPSAASAPGASSSRAEDDAAPSTDGPADAAPPVLPPACEQEAEPNDTPERANDLAPARCGTVGKRDRRDYLTFRVKPTTNTLSLRFSGQVRLIVEVEGAKDTELVPDEDAEIPFVDDADYLVEVRPLKDAETPITWRVEVVEK